MRIAKENIIKTISKEELIKIAKEHKSITGILNKLGVKIHNYYFSMLKERLKQDNIEYIRGHKPHAYHKHRTLDEILTKNSNFCRSNIKRRLLKEGVIKNKCGICKQADIWKGKKLIMVLDHINGINNDNRLENLRMLCPNCNSQQETFAGRNISIAPIKKIIKHCPICKKKIQPYSNCCRQCRLKFYNKNLPSKEELKKLMDTYSMRELGEKFGVCGNAVRKWAIKYRLKLPRSNYLKNL